MPAKVNKGHKSVKHDIIDKTNSRMLLAIGIATFIAIFSVFAIRALISQSLYQNRVISQKEDALSQIKDNRKSIEELKKSYDSFASSKQNIIGGSSTGTGALDGSNPDIVLDALPENYDYPALSSSFEKILKEGGYTIGSIGGTEDSDLAQSSQESSQAISIPYAFTISTDVNGMEKLLVTLEKSIRPMYVDSLQVQVGDSVLQTKVNLHTFFAPTKTFTLGSKEVK